MSVTRTLKLTCLLVSQWLIIAVLCSVAVNMSTLTFPFVTRFIICSPPLSLIWTQVDTSVFVSLRDVPNNLPVNSYQMWKSQTNPVPLACSCGNCSVDTICCYGPSKAVVSSPNRVCGKCFEEICVQKSRWCRVRKKPTTIIQYWHCSREWTLRYFTMPGVLSLSIWSLTAQDVWFFRDLSQAARFQLDPNMISSQRGTDTG